MRTVLWRILIAVFACLFFWALLPPVLRVIGFDITADVLAILRLCIGGLALIYICFGPEPPWIVRS